MRGPNHKGCGSFFDRSKLIKPLQLDETGLNSEADVRYKRKAPACGI